MKYKHHTHYNTVTVHTFNRNGDLIDNRLIIYAVKYGPHTVHPYITILQTFANTLMDGVKTLQVLSLTSQLLLPSSSWPVRQLQTNENTVYHLVYTMIKLKTMNCSNWCGLVFGMQMLKCNNNVYPLYITIQCILYITITVQ